MKTATLNSKGQVIIPAEIRARFGIVAGDKISFELQVDAALLRVVKAESVQAIRGMFGKAKVSATLEDMAQAVRERAGEQHAKI